MSVKICDNLRILRSKERYSMEDVAEIIGVSRQSVAKWESGESLPDIEKCVKLAKLYKVTLDEFVSENLAEKDFESDEGNGKYNFGFVPVEDNKISIPERAREIFGISSGDVVMFLGDTHKGGLAIVKVAIGELGGK